MKQKSIIECQKPRLFLDTHKPKELSDLIKIKKLLNLKEFPKYQKKLSLAILMSLIPFQSIKVVEEILERTL